ncbi:MAG: aminotransferase class V-fold PLP-dependent enzyme [Oscillospiraceae bacterium]|nr:aminotransferase class V-fold PLP-dependent enzyme [Oscillospiraceae bacterium]
MIYLDNAATTQKKPVSVKKAMIAALENAANSGRGGYDAANIAADYIFRARERLAELFGVSDCGQIAFTNNATQALNMAIKGNALKNGHCVVSGYEHNSVVRPVASLSENEVTFSVARGALFRPEELIVNFEKSFEKNTTLAVCTHVSNAFGYILPIKEIDEICYKKGVPLVIDASQSAGSIKLKMDNFKAVTCICAPGHKGLYGPQGTGVLVCRNGEKMKTIIEGGTGSLSGEIFQPAIMPDRFESGTLNTPGIAGLSEGVSYVLERTPEKIFAYERELINILHRGLKNNRKIKSFYTKDDSLQSGVLSFVVDGLLPETFAERLCERKIAVRSGKHCSALAHETVKTRFGTVRVSVSDFTTINEVEAFLEAVFEITRKI